MKQCIILFMLILLSYICGAELVEQTIDIETEDGNVTITAEDETWAFNCSINKSYERDYTFNYTCSISERSEIQNLTRALINQTATFLATCGTNISTDYIACETGWAICRTTIENKNERISELKNESKGWEIEYNLLVTENEGKDIIIAQKKEDINGCELELMSARKEADAKPAWAIVGGILGVIITVLFKKQKQGGTEADLIRRHV